MPHTLVRGRADDPVFQDKGSKRTGFEDVFHVMILRSMDRMARGTVLMTKTAHAAPDLLISGRTMHVSTERT